MGAAPWVLEYHDPTQNTTVFTYVRLGVIQEPALCLITENPVDNVQAALKIVI
jgi:hypothetical protein